MRDITQARRRAKAEAAAAAELARLEAERERERALQAAHARDLGERFGYVRKPKKTLSVL